MIDDVKYFIVFNLFHVHKKWVFVIMMCKDM